MVEFINCWGTLVPVLVVEDVQYVSSGAEWHFILFFFGYSFLIWIYLSILRCKATSKKSKKRKENLIRS